MSELSHLPVMRHAAVALMRPRDNGVYLDGTFGGGGYARAILEAAACTLFAIDRDPQAIARGRELAAAFAGRLHLIEGRISQLSELLRAAGVRALDGAVFDLGVSSYQLDDPERGFSFRHDGPLDMRMEESGATAAMLVNSLGESELADILFRFGEEKASRRIARAIITRRHERKFTTTADLANVIRGVVRPDKSGIDPATRSFQALRIAVNGELEEIAAALAQVSRLLLPGGRLVVVSFHSLEDRIVKHFMAEAAGRAGHASRHAPSARDEQAAPEFRVLTGRGRVPEPAEIRANPRARSARLRAMERLAA